MSHPNAARPRGGPGEGARRAVQGRAACAGPSAAPRAPRSRDVTAARAEPRRLRPGASGAPAAGPDCLGSALLPRPALPPPGRARPRALLPAATGPLPGCAHTRPQGRRPGSLFLLGACRASPEARARPAPPPIEFRQPRVRPWPSSDWPPPPSIASGPPPRRRPVSGGNAGQSGLYCCCVIGERRRPLAAAPGTAGRPRRTRSRAPAGRRCGSSPGPVVGAGRCSDGPAGPADVHPGPGVRSGYPLGSAWSQLCTPAGRQPA
ncbi:uncharacterized protein LOC121828971 [Peromyscus maniculatus bairdii]|uniref:uncharacterized protein LOC121828971 n=1 Tax=Peromyscus maniculatus bairdii TaxID=230844 RepID=UPI003FD04DEA